MQQELIMLPLYESHMSSEDNTSERTSRSRSFSVEPPHRRSGADTKRPLSVEDLRIVVSALRRGAPEGRRKEEPIPKHLPQLYREIRFLSRSVRDSRKQNSAEQRKHFREVRNEYEHSVGLLKGQLARKTFHDKGKRFSSTDLLGMLDEYWSPGHMGYPSPTSSLIQTRPLSWLLKRRRCLTE